MEVIDQSLQPLVAALGFPLDQLKFVLCMLLAYPVGFLFRFIPGSLGKNIYSIVFGVGFLVLSLGPFAWIHSFVSSLITYIAVRTLRPSTSLRFVFVFAFAYMSVSHIYRTLTDYMGWTLDFTGSQMIVTLKLISFAFNVKDAKVKLLTPVLDDIKDEKERASKRRSIAAIEELNKERQVYAIHQMPSLVEYFGFIYFPTTLLAGPCFEFNDYRALCDGSLFKSAPGGKMPKGAWLAALKVFVQSLAMMGLVMVGQAYFPMSFLNSDTYANDWNQLTRWGYLWACMVLIRCKYYFGWFLAEGSAVLSGLGYNGIDKQGKALWNRTTNVQVLPVEFPENARSVSAAWNSSTATWLKRYVYTRVNRPGVASQTGTYATFVVSAFWHGFYPGYYISFVSGAVFVEAARLVRRDIGPLFASKGKLYSRDGPLAKFSAVYDAGAIAATMWVFAYMCGSFQLLDFYQALNLYRNLYFVPHITVISALVLLNVAHPVLKKFAPPTNTASPVMEAGSSSSRATLVAPVKKE